MWGKSALFTKKKIHKQCQNNTDNQHGGERDEHKAVLILNAYITG
jgi:hypothetical protein